MTGDEFRARLPEFTSLVIYSDDAVTFWLGLAEQNVSAERWGQNYELGILYYTAHHLVLEARNGASATTGAAPGGVTGPIASKSVGSVAVSYASSTVTKEGDGAWNLTSYGVRYRQLVRIAGMGGIQL